MLVIPYGRCSVVPGTCGERAVPSSSGRSCSPIEFLIEYLRRARESPYQIVYDPEACMSIPGQCTLA